jgi:flagellar protein FlaI
MATMHAENLDSAVKRLTSKPMDIAPAYIPLMNIVLPIQRVHLTKNNVKKAYRRVISVNEITDYEEYQTSFKWYPAKDEHISILDQSTILASIAEREGMGKNSLLEEISRRKDVLQWMRKRGIRSYKDVAAIVGEYCAKPKQIYEKVLAGEEVEEIAVSRKA